MFNLEGYGKEQPLANWAQRDIKFNATLTTL